MYSLQLQFLDLMAMATGLKAIPELRGSVESRWSLDASLQEI